MKTAEEVLQEHYDVYNPHKSALKAMQTYAAQYQQEWIDVKDRLPEAQTVVLVYTVDGYTQTAFFELETKSWVGIGNYRAPKVTYWMQLPNQPNND